MDEIEDYDPSNDCIYEGEEEVEQLTEEEIEAVREADERAYDLFHGLSSEEGDPEADEAWFLERMDGAVRKSCLDSESGSR